MKFSIVPIPCPPKEYVITLTEREAKMLYAVVGSVSLQNNIRQELTDKLYTDLCKAFGNFYNCGCGGCMEIKAMQDFPNFSDTNHEET